MFKKRDKRRVRIVGFDEPFGGKQRVVFSFFVGNLEYRGQVDVLLGKDVWDAIGERLEEEDVALLQQEREV